MSTYGTLCEMPADGQYFLIEALDIASTETVKDWDNALVTFLPNEIILTTLDPVNEDKLPVRQVYHHPAGDPPHYTFITDSDIPLVFIPSSFDMPKLAIFENKALTEGIVLTLHKSNMGKLAKALLDNPELLKGLLPSNKEPKFCFYPWSLLSFEVEPSKKEFIDVLNRNSVEFKQYDSLLNKDVIEIDFTLDESYNGKPDVINLNIRTEFFEDGKIWKQVCFQKEDGSFIRDLYDGLLQHKYYIKSQNSKGYDHLYRSQSGHYVTMYDRPDFLRGNEFKVLRVGYSM